MVLERSGRIIVLCSYQRALELVVVNLVRENIGGTETLLLDRSNIDSFVREA